MFAMSQARQQWLYLNLPGPGNRHVQSSMFFGPTPVAHR